MPHVLIVDDNPMQRFLIQEILAEDGSFTFREASDAEMAFAQLQAEPFDLVLLEIWRKKIDALQLCRTVKDIPAFQTMKVVFVTIYWSVRWAAQQNGADAFLAKPYNPDELQTLVYRLLDPGEGISQLTN